MNAVKDETVQEKTIEQIRKEAAYKVANKVIEQESQLLNNRKYSNLELNGCKLTEMPLNVMQYFTKTICSTPRHIIGTTEKNPLPLAMHPLLHISKISVSDLIFGHIGIILNVLSGAIIRDWGVSDEEAMKDCVILEEIANQYGELFAQIDKELEDKFNAVLSQYDKTTWKKKSTSDFHK